MSDETKATRRLRRLLEEPGIIRSMGAHDVLTALLIERAGFETVFLGGFGASASLRGLPDLNFLELEEMATAVERMARRISIPLIADGDTGYGGPEEVQECVRAFEAAGAAGILLEDQVFPKRCGHFDGNSVIPAEEMVAKLQAALEARRDEDFVIFARTDARQSEGIDAAIGRINRYCSTGADVAFVEAPQSREELLAIAERVPYPKFANMLSFGKTPLLTASELEELGFKFVVAPIETLLVAARAIESLAETFLRDGSAAARKEEMMGFEELKEVLELEKYLRLREEEAPEK
ncbi:MAG: isocitrate lyase/PEP mutase family protein [Planctomycetota bacterium]|nr:isocitrate lyase/PEP mutase family protein [Planctomycetota bacterium]